VWSGNESPVADNISRIVACSSTCFAGHFDHLATEGLGAYGLALQARGEELTARGVASVRSKPKHAFVPIRVKSTAVIKRSSGAN